MGGEGRGCKTAFNYDVTSNTPEISKGRALVYHNHCDS